MGILSKVRWTDNTWNPWHGCEKVNEACEYCYMFRDKMWRGQDPTKVVRSKTKFNEPLLWTQPCRVFTCSWSDWFIKEADEWRDEAWAIINNTPQLTYQILTKRIGRARHHLPASWGSGWENVWLGTSIGLQKHMFMKKQLIQTPAHVRFLSLEPLLGPLELGDLTGIDWVIIGGESGNDQGEHKYRECRIEWIESIIEQCRAQNVSIFVKQMGTFISKQLKITRHGTDINEFPPHLQIQEMPKAYKQPADA